MKLLLNFCILFLFVFANEEQEENTTISDIEETPPPSDNKSENFLAISCPKIIEKLNYKIRIFVKERDYIIKDINYDIQQVFYSLNSSSITNKTKINEIYSSLLEIKDNLKNVSFTNLTMPITCVDHNESLSLQCLGLGHQEAAIEIFMNNLEIYKDLVKLSLDQIQNLSAIAKNESYASRSNREYYKWKYLSNDINHTVKILQFYFDLYIYDIAKLKKTNESLEIQSNLINCIDESEKKNPKGIVALFYDDEFAVNNSTLLYDNLIFKYDNNLFAFAAFLTTNFSQANFICHCGFGEIYSVNSNEDFNSVFAYFNQTENFVDVWIGEKSCINIANNATIIEQSRMCKNDENGPLEYGVFCKFHEVVIEAFYKNVTIFDLKK